MPFDGIGYEGRIEALNKMDKVIHLLSDHKRWCKKQLQTHDGRRCILGAIMAADAVSLEASIFAAITEVTGRDYGRIEMFNDHPLTTHARVLKVLHQARENIINDVAIPREARALGSVLEQLTRRVRASPRTRRPALGGTPKHREGDCCLMSSNGYRLARQRTLSLLPPTTTLRRRWILPAPY